MLKGLVFGQLKKGLRDGDSQRLSIAIIGIGLLAFLRITRAGGRRPIYRRRIRASETIQLRMRERPAR